MALETGTYTSDLVATNPTAGDPLSQADDHLRLLKSTIKATFPNITGPVTLTQAQLNGTAQTWQNVAGSRLVGTTYTNSTTQTIQVAVSLQQSTASPITLLATLTGGVQVWGSTVGTSGFASSTTFNVPPGGTYVLNNAGSNSGVTIFSWSELR